MQKNLLLLPALTSETAFPIQRTMEDSWAPSAQQANALRELRHCAAGVARGVLRLGQAAALADSSARCLVLSQNKQRLVSSVCGFKAGDRARQAVFHRCELWSQDQRTGSGPASVFSFLPTPATTSVATTKGCGNRFCDVLRHGNHVCNVGETGLRCLAARTGLTLCVWVGLGHSRVRKAGPDKQPPKLSPTHPTSFISAS